MDWLKKVWSQNRLLIEVVFASLCHVPSRLALYWQDGGFALLLKLLLCSPTKLLDLAKFHVSHAICHPVTSKV